MKLQKLDYLVTQLYINCKNLTNREISRILGIIEKERIMLESTNNYLATSGLYLSAEYNDNFNQLQNLHIDTSTLINMLKVRAVYIGLSSTSTTQINKSN